MPLYAAFFLKSNRGLFMNSRNDLAMIVWINEDIKSVVKLARSINLLALNAIILSRKAGNVALGFCVISDELRLFSKTLTQTMQTLMQLSYTSVQTVSLYQRHLRMNKLMNLASQQIADTACKVKLQHNAERAILLRNNTIKTYESLQNHLMEAEEASRFGSVISRSLKIEATYGGDFSRMLMQISLDFTLFIDAIPEIIGRLDKNIHVNFIK